MPKRIIIARAIAIGADILQIGLFPLFGPGIASPLNIALDSVVCLILTWLVGWHIAFLPSFLAEGIPLMDLAPTWTLAIWIKTRKMKDTPLSTPEPTQKPQPKTHPSNFSNPVIDVETMPTLQKPIPAPPVLTPTSSLHPTSNNFAKQPTS